MRRYSATEASKKFGALLREADAGPVEIGRNGPRRRYVLMSREVFDVYETIREAHSRDRVLATFESAMGKLVDGERDKAFKLMRIGNALLGRWLDATGEKL